MSNAPSPKNRGYANLPIPFGWFAVAMSDEIAAGDVKTMTYFGTEFVMWRGEDQELRAVNPYCPHLGAHLGVNSNVVGNDLRCPFHHWTFNGNGGVTGIPYAKVIAPSMKRSCLPSWPVQESGGVVYVWYHPKKEAPKWELAQLPKCVEDGVELGDWVPAGRHEWIINIHIQEITENGQDHAHFAAVHNVPGAPSADFKLDGWGRRNTIVAEMNTPRGPMTGKIDITAVGPGQSITEYSDVTHVLQVQQATPIDSEHTQIRWQLFHAPGASDGKLRVAQARMRDLAKQIEQDIPIWNQKIFMEKPLLVQGDGPLLAYRRQYAKFHAEDVAIPAE